VADRRSAAARPGAAVAQPGLLIDDRRARLLVAGLEALSVLTGAAPRRQIGEPLCRLFGLAWYAAVPSARAAVRDNLRHILGHEPNRAQVREVFFHGALNYWDILAIPHLSRAQVLALVTLTGKERIEAALANGKGVILAGAHLSSVSLAGQSIPANGIPVLSMVEPIEPPRLFDFFARSRAGSGARMLPATPATLRELLATLRRNEVLGIVSDRDITGTGPFVQFFDAPTRFPDGLPALSVRTGAPILPSVAIRHPDGKYEALIDTPIPIPNTGDHRRDILELTQAMATRLQYHVANHPEQWTVFQRRWPLQAARD
jgi:KDO2-lipid IV(A) lauroyltransferase